MSEFTVVGMDTQRLDGGRTVDTARAGRSVERLPWAALVTMAVTVFIVVSGEMMPTAVLPALATDLDVSLAWAGLLVSAWAATVVVASFPLTRLTARFERPTVIAGALTVFAVATLVTASAGTYAAAMGSRLVAAAATGLLWSSINAHAASIVPERRIARATAIVLFGGMLGTVGGIPAGNALAEVASWRLPFALLGVLALVAVVVVLVVLRRQPTVPAASEDGAQRPASRRSLRPVLAIAGLGGLVLIGHFMVFTFVAEILAPSVVPVPILLLTFGLAGAVGVALVGATSDRHPNAVPLVMALLMAASLASLIGVGRHGAIDMALVGLWGLVVGAVGPAVQVSLMRAAGVQHRTTAGTLMPVAMNLGIALGAAAGSGVTDRWSPGSLPLLALVPALIALAGFVVLAWRANAPAT
jgi:DHA1 family inner membrane transport protein